MLKVIILAGFVAIAVASTSEASTKENVGKERESRQAVRPNTGLPWWNGLDRIPGSSPLRLADDPLMARSFRGQERGGPGIASTRIENTPQMARAFARPEVPPVAQAVPAAAAAGFRGPNPAAFRTESEATGAPRMAGSDGLASNVSPGLPSDQALANGPNPNVADLSNSQRFIDDPSAAARGTDQTGRIIEFTENMRPRGFNNNPRAWPVGSSGRRENSPFINGGNSPVNSGLLPPEVLMSAAPIAQRYNIDSSLGRAPQVPAGLADRRPVYNAPGPFGPMPNQGGIPVFGRNRYGNTASLAQIGPDGRIETQPTFDPSWNPNQRFNDPNGHSSPNGQPWALKMANVHSTMRHDPNYSMHASSHLPHWQTYRTGLLGTGPGIFGSRYTISDKIRFLLRDWVNRNNEML